MRSVATAEKAYNNNLHFEMSFSASLTLKRTQIYQFPREVTKQGIEYIRRRHLFLSNRYRYCNSLFAKLLRLSDTERTRRSNVQNVDSFRRDIWRINYIDESLIFRKNCCVFAGKLTTRFALI